MSTETEKKPSIEAQAPQTYLQVEAGIYRYKDKEGKVTYHERPSINGTRTYRSLGYNFTAQHNIKLAREEYRNRETALSKGENLYVDQKPQATPRQETNMARPRPVFRARRSTPLGFGCAAARYARLRSASPQRGGGKGKKDNLQKEFYTPTGTTC